MRRRGWKCFTAALLLFCLALPGCSPKNDVPEGTDGAALSDAGGLAETVQLDPENPVNITVWHYYNGVQQEAFNQLANEFNQTTGREKGIYVTGYSQGSVGDLEDSIVASANKEVGSQELPNIVSTYADTAYVLEQLDSLANLDEYLSGEECAEYLESYIEEGRIGKNNELRIFPTAKSSEIFLINKTEWERFVSGAGADAGLLETKEGVAQLSRQYYEWTDSLTPDVPGDGGAFYGRDSVANLFIVGSMQLGSEIFQVENGKAALNLDKDVMRKIWDVYYVPYVKGYYGAFGRFRSDDVKTGDLVATVGSTTSSMYFPDQVEKNGTQEPIEYMVLPTPVFEDGENYAVQQGAGMAVIKSAREEEYASVEFLKWFTQEENNIMFGCGSGYLPVKKAANNQETLDYVIQEKGIEVNPKTYDALLVEFDVLKNNTLYTNKAFEGGAEARDVLETHLHHLAEENRALVRAAAEEGQEVEAAAESYTDEAAFEAWFADFEKALIEILE